LHLKTAFPCSRSSVISAVTEVGSATTVCDGIDELLARHGYIHDGKIYRVERENSDTVVLFCHFGVECVLLSHILKISPVVLWHNLKKKTEYMQDTELEMIILEGVSYCKDCKKTYKTTILTRDTEK